MNKDSVLPFLGRLAVGGKMPNACLVIAFTGSQTADYAFGITLPRSLAMHHQVWGVGGMDANEINFYVYYALVLTYKYFYIATSHSLDIFSDRFVKKIDGIHLLYTSRYILQNSMGYL